MNPNNDAFFFYGDTVQESPEKEVVYKQWIKDDDHYKPVGKVKITKRLLPGRYEIINTQQGTQIHPVEVSNDELFKFENIGIANILNEVYGFWDKAPVYKEHKLIHKRGLMLYGPGGTGKTSIINIVCEDIIAKGGLIFSIGNIKDLLEFIDFAHVMLRPIQPETPVVVVIEDIDTFLDENYGTKTLLNFLDGEDSLEHCLVIATTNVAESMSDVLIRPSRFDWVVEVNVPTDDVRREYFVAKNAPAELIEDLVKDSKGMSISEIKEMFISVVILGYSTKSAGEKIKEQKAVASDTIYKKKSTAKSVGFGK